MKGGKGNHDEPNLGGIHPPVQAAGGLLNKLGCRDCFLLHGILSQAGCARGHIWENDASVRFWLCKICQGWNRLSFGTDWSKVHAEAEHEVRISSMVGIRLG